MAFGIPTVPEIAKLLQDGIAEAQTAGVALEDHLPQLVHGLIADALTQVQADLNTDLGQLNDIIDHGLDRMEALIDRLEKLAERGIVVQLGAPK